MIDCPTAAAVIELLMTDRDLVEAATDLATMRVTFGGQQRVRLDEHGDWEPILGDR